MKGYLSKEPDFEVVGEYADGESTWAGIKSLRPQVALLDIRMPGLDGITISAHGARRGASDRGADAHVVRREPVRARGAARGARAAICSRPLRWTRSRKRYASRRGGGFYLDSEVASAVEGGDNFVPEPVSVREARGASARGARPLGQGDSGEALHKRTHGADAPRLDIRQAWGEKQDGGHAARDKIRDRNDRGTHRLK